MTNELTDVRITVRLQAIEELARRARDRVFHPRPSKPAIRAAFDDLEEAIAEFLAKAQEVQG